MDALLVIDGTPSQGDAHEAAIIRRDEKGDRRL
jgi:hypothetical protein